MTEGKDLSPFCRESSHSGQEENGPFHPFRMLSSHSQSALRFYSLVIS